jgi:hypothetical protein
VHCLLNQPLGLARFAQIGDDPVQSTGLLASPFDPSSVAAGDDDLGALGGQLRRRGQADAAGRAGDDADPIGEAKLQTALAY